MNAPTGGVVRPKLALMARDRQNRPVALTNPRGPSTRTALFALEGAVVIVALLAGGAARADDASDARRHAQRGSSLAAAGKCKQAVVEFDKALAVIRDPALLFNRAECHRKLGEPEAALEDYNQFLADLPKAPNRKLVESRIAELSKPASATPPAEPAVAPGAQLTRDKSKAATAKAAPPAAASEPKPSDLGVTPPVAAAPAPSLALPSAPPPAGEGTAASASLSLQDASPPPSSSSDESIASRPWFWIAVGVAVVAVAAGTFVLINRDGTSVPPSDLGNYKF